MIKEAIIKLSKKQDLAYAEAEAVMDEIMSGQATPVQMSAYLTALALKGETIDVDGENGYVLVCVAGYPLGWGKRTNGSIKNKYLAGWRLMS